MRLEDQARTLVRSVSTNVTSYLRVGDKKYHPRPSRQTTGQNENQHIFIKQNKTKQNSCETLTGIARVILRSRVLLFFLWPQS